MRRFGLFGFLVLLLLVGAVGAVSYNLGVSTGAAEAAIAEGAAVVYAPAAGLSPFGLVVGFLFLVLIIGFIAKAFAGPRIAMGHGPWGHAGHRWRGDWHDEDVPEPFRPMLDRWHRETHGSPSTQGPTAEGGAPAPQGPPPSAHPQAAPPGNQPPGPLPGSHPRGARPPVGQPPR